VAIHGRRAERKTPDCKKVDGIPEMITVTEVPDTNIVALRVDGDVSATEFDDALNKVDTLIQRHGAIRILEQIGQPDSPPVRPSDQWYNPSFGYNHLGAITHTAVISDQTCVTAFVKFFDPHLSTEIRSFKLSESDRAQEWLMSSQ
jgi:hypothetical protein